MLELELDGRPGDIVQLKVSARTREYALIALLETAQDDDDRKHLPPEYEEVGMIQMTHGWQDDAVDDVNVQERRCSAFEEIRLAYLGMSS